MIGTGTMADINSSRYRAALVFLGLLIPATNGLAQDGPSPTDDAPASPPADPAATDLPAAPQLPTADEIAHTPELLPEGSNVVNVGHRWSTGDRVARFITVQSEFDPDEAFEGQPCEARADLWVQTSTHTQHLEAWPGACGENVLLRPTENDSVIALRCYTDPDVECYGEDADDCGGPNTCDVYRIEWSPNDSTPTIGARGTTGGYLLPGPSWADARAPAQAIRSAFSDLRRALASRDVDAARRTIRRLWDMRAARSEIDRGQIRLNRIIDQRAREQARRWARERAERERELARARAETRRHVRAAQDFYAAISCSVWSMSGQLTGYTQAYVPNLPSQQLARFGRGRAYSGSMFMTSPLGQRLPGRYYVFYGGDGVRLALVIGEAELMYEVRRVAGPRGRRTITLWEQNSASTGVLREDRVRSRAAAESLPDRCPVRGP